MSIRLKDEAALKAASATKLATARTIALSGDVTGSVTFDGSANATITTTVADDSHNHTIANVDGLQSALDAKAPLASPTLTGTPKAPTAAAGTNTTQLATTAFVTTAVNNKTSVSGNAGTATKLQTARTINGVSFDGTANITVADNTKLPLSGGTLTGGVTVGGVIKDSRITTGNQQLINGTSSTIYVGNPGTMLALESDAHPRVTIGSTSYTLHHSGNPQTTVSGNAGTATKLQTARTINGTSFDGSANITTANWGTARTITIGNTGKSVNGSGNVSWTLAEIGAVGLASPAFTGTPTAPTAAAGTNTTQLATTAFVTTAVNNKTSVSGNAATATTLQTARTINGTSFNGSANITTANWGTARNITIGNTTKSVNGSANMSWSLSEIGAAAASHTHSNYVPTSTGSAVTIHADSDSSSTSEYLLLKAGHNELKIASSAGGTTVTKGQDKLTFNGNIVYHAGRKPTTSEIGAIPLTGSTAVTGTLRTSGELQSTSANAIRAVQGNYGAIIRNDGADTYFLLTNSGDQYGQWNNLRPLTINNASGKVTFGNGISGTLTGNASTATTLQTARTINGTSFNGSANITTANWGTARTLTVGKTGKSVNGSGNISWSLGEIGALPAAGGTLTGDLKIQKADNGFTLLYKNHNASSDYGTNLDDYKKDGTKSTLTVNANASANNVLTVTHGSSTYKVYHEGNKPGQFNPVSIPGNTNLNNYTTPGMYFCAMSAHAATIAYCPTDLAFSLLVEKHAGVKQTLTEYTTSAIPQTYVRNQYNGAWGKWHAVPNRQTPHWYNNSLGPNLKAEYGFQVGIDQFDRGYFKGVIYGSADIKHNAVLCYLTASQTPDATRYVACNYYNGSYVCVGGGYVSVTSSGTVTASNPPAGARAVLVEGLTYALTTVTGSAPIGTVSLLDEEATEPAQNLFEDRDNLISIYELDENNFFTGKANIIRKDDEIPEGWTSTPLPAKHIKLELVDSEWVERGDLATLEIPTPDMEEIINAKTPMQILEEKNVQLEKELDELKEMVQQLASK